VVLSAQCTDRRVNMVTPVLFGQYPDPPRLAAAGLPEIEAIIHSTGFFRAKARNLKAMAEALVSQHQGAVPEDLDALTALPGVGRKTANVVLGNAFGIASGVVVDTHVKRLAHRLGLTHNETPERIEHEDRAENCALSHRLIEHGRRTCVARSPRCEVCALATICPRQGLGSD
jgi:endonuclease-3